MPSILAGQSLKGSSSCQGSTPPLAQTQASWADSDLPACSRGECVLKR